MNFSVVSLSIRDGIQYIWHISPIFPPQVAYFTEFSFANGENFLISAKKLQALPQDMRRETAQKSYSAVLINCPSR
jgi:hypothetical protein